jgi:hypothetical protein
MSGRRLLAVSAFCVAALAPLAALAGCGETTQRREVTVLGSLAEIRLDQPVPDGAASARLLAARNELESFQVAVTPGRARRVEIAAAGPLRGPAGAEIAARDVSVYREVGYRVGPPGGPPSSDAGGEAGSYPDALIPARDDLYGERRDAFPVEVAAGETVVAWIDVYVPPPAAAGVYRGAIEVSGVGARPRRGPVAVRVLPFSLPSTTSLPSSFGFEWTSVCSAHTGSESCDGDRELAWKLSSLYARLALDDRITISDPFPLDHASAPEGPRESSLFRRYGLPLTNGTAATRLPGARLSTVAAYWPCVVGVEGGSSSRCLGTWRRLAEEGGFANRFFVYACNEPEDDEALWEECRTAAREASERWPRAPTLIAASIGEAVESGGAPGDQIGLRYFDTMAVLVNNMANRPGTGYEGDQRGNYDGFLRGEYGAEGSAPKSLWLYTSCQSYGCEGDRSDPSLFEGWPGYGIDQEPSEARAMGWLTFDYDAPGELYYQTTSLLPTAWTDSYRSGGNGDGTLFYPGLPAGGDGGAPIGGRRQIPLDSIRMKRIRDGREDYEYLHLLAGEGRRAAAEKVVESVFGPSDTAMFGADVDESELEGARHRLAALITAGRR